MDMKNLRETSEQDLKKLLQEKRGELGQKSFRSHMGELKNHQEIRTAKKEIAQILTVLRTQELQDILKLSKIKK